jgi:hypothetical protein
MKTRFSMASVISITAGVLILQSCSLIPGSLTETASAIVAEGEALDLKLGDGAAVNIDEASLPASTTVTLRSVPVSEWTNPAPDGIFVGRVYELTAEGWGAGLQGTLKLPIETKDLKPQEIEEYALAYYLNGEWVVVPSTVNMEEATVSGPLTHCSFFATIRRLFGNKRPIVTVEAKPRVYSGVGTDQLLDVNLENLVVDVHADDPENKPVKVYLAFGFDTLETWAVNEMLTLRESLGDLMLISAYGTSLIEGETAAFDVANQIRDQIAPPATSVTLYTPWIELIKNESGFYQGGYDLSGLRLQSPLHIIQVFVRVTDDIESDPVEITELVPITSEKLPDAITLKDPRPNAVCPTQPTFRWSWEGTADEAKSYRFRLVKGADVWGKWFAEADWVCGAFAGCDRGGPDEFFAQEWTPTKPLSNGVYGWGLISSHDPNERKFNNIASSVHSDMFRFMVDDSLRGSECVSPQEFSTFTQQVPLQGGLATETPLRVTAEPIATPRICTHRFFPTAVGATWEYRSSFLNRSADLRYPEGSKVIGNVRLRIDEVTADYSTGVFWQPPIDPKDLSYKVTFDCDSFGMHVGAGPGVEFYLPYELAPGMSWQDKREVYPVQFQSADEMATITVPAGTFEVLCVTKTYKYATPPPPGTLGHSFFTFLIACFSEGVGEITEEWHSTFPRDDSLEELVSYSIP